MAKREEKPTYQKLDPLYKVGKCVVAKGKQEGREPKGDLHDEQHLQDGKKSVQKSRGDVNFAPGPIDHVVLVR